ncbi:MAG: zinc ribbon domain-containing protein [Prevotella sp.]|nr:zinc ribbon domain-containing protein [Prevotella sp.]
MAIIKCPECGHQISDKAPTCPSCGVEIAGHITHCPQCGAVYLKDQDACPICHCSNVSPRSVETRVVPPPIPPVTRENTQENAPKQEPPKKKRHWGALLFAFLMALTICGVCLYFYHTAKDSKETEAFNYAITSSDPLVLQSFLNTYKDASASRKDSIQTRLTYIEQMERDWTNACVSKSKSMLNDYIKNYPESPHKGDALNKIDSIDWAAAKELNTIEGYEQYAKTHPNGSHTAQAEEEMKNLAAKVLQPEEMEFISNLYRRFYQSINQQNPQGLAETVAPTLSSFMGLANAGKTDVVQFMFKQWKDGVSNLNWYIIGDYKIEKHEVSTDLFDYDVTFIAKRKVEYETEPTKETKYMVTSKVDENGLISAYSMHKIVE